MNKKHNDFWPKEPDDTKTMDQEANIIWVSKSEIKRDADALKKLGLSLTKLSPAELEKIPLDTEILDAIMLAQKIKKEGHRRQIQWIGKLLRNRDVIPIEDALDRLKNKHNQYNALLQKLEQLRDSLIETGDAEHIMALYPKADRQLLRTLARTARKEKLSNKGTKTTKQIYQYLKQLSELE